jgi:hypothetical protein
MLLIGAALMTGGSALASAQTISLQVAAYHDRDRDRDRDYDRRYYDRDYGRHYYDRDDRRYFHDREARRRYYEHEERRFDRVRWRWDGAFWLYWDGHRWCR